VACWGKDSNGSLGQGSIGIGSSTPKLVVGGISFDRLAVGHGTNCGIAVNSRVYCWGSGSYGERGDGTMDLQMGVPVKVQAP
jgi:alpha-tubulin suppressor-like RCC1 family protein